ncbi:MAG: penicillin acylase family protein [Magnetospirillum sp. WYHS-4]
MPLGLGRILGWGAAGAACVMLAAGLAAFIFLRSSLPSLSGNVTIGAESGLVAPVDIYRDGHGVPHINAKSADDAYFALGFAHAQDRLWQMESMRRTGAGRLSEVLGERTLDTDRLMRTLGLYALAERQIERLFPETRRVLEVYAAGVNAYLKGHEGALPLEFLLLGLSPEPWRPADSLVWGKLMALKLGRNWQDEILRSRLAKRLPAEAIDLLWGRPPRDHRTTASALPYEALAEALPKEWRISPRGASNAWALDSAHSVTGKPLLANDPHLGFEAPIPWYLARMEAPDLSATGATIPGVPFLILGHNGKAAWGFASTEADVSDLFVEQVDPADQTRYLTPDGPQPFVTRSEIIKVRGSADSVLEVRQTRHGPVISDILDKARQAVGQGSLLSLSATWLRDGDLTPQALHGFVKAGDWESFRANLADFHAPPLTVVYADTKGIAQQVTGKIPVRRGDRGWTPQPGWTGEADWTGFIPFRDLPQSVNPPDGRLVAANQKIVPEGYEPFISDDWAPGYRARRIHQMLDASPSHSVDTLSAQQRDHLSSMSQELLPLMTAFRPSETREQQVVKLLAHWNGEMTSRRPEPLIFVAWLRELNRALYADETGELFPDVWSLRPGFVAEVLNGHHEWCDDVTTAEIREDCPSRLELALRTALDNLGRHHGGGYPQWRWGAAHMARFHHPLLAAYGIGRLETPTDGGDDTVNRGTSRIATESRPFDHVHGAGLRAIYDLADLDRARFMIATGQSGNPLSRHFDDLLPEWRDGRYLRLGLTWGDLERNGQGRLTLTP